MRNDVIFKAGFCIRKPRTYDCIVRSLLAFQQFSHSVTFGNNVIVTNIDQRML